MEIASRPEDVPPWQMSGKDDLDEVIAAAVWPFNFHLFATIDSQCLLVTSKKKKFNHSEINLKYFPSFSGIIKYSFQIFNVINVMINEIYWLEVAISLNISI